MPVRFAPAASRPARRGGFALVLVLSMLVLVTVLVMAFFTRASMNRKIVASSVAQQQVQFLTDFAVDLIVGDLRHEFAAGSDEDSGSQVGSPRFLPLTVNTAHLLHGTNRYVSTAPSMAPSRTVSSQGDSPSTLVKQSLRDIPFFRTGPGLVNHTGLPPVPVRASASNTTEVGPGGAFIRSDRWLLPGLAGEEETIAPPDWIYVDRSGRTPSNFNANWAEPASGNTNAIIGRFAYNVYDVGGLIDINVIGNLLDENDEDGGNARRGRLHQVQLGSAPDDLAVPAFNEFLQWRGGGSPGLLSDKSWLFEPTRNFLQAPAGTQRLLNRQELLDYVRRDDSPIPPSALRFLTPLSRDLNAPSHVPEPNRPLYPDAATAEGVNPPLASVVFPSQTTLSRGSGPALTVPEGTPVMLRRFPLSKLDLLNDPGADPADLEYYFGLERNADGTFRYTAVSDEGRIRWLEEVAAEGREPNFFEVLKAVILAGSLGRNAGNVYTIEQPKDVARDPQIIQIGANIIDQWDENNLPTTIEFPTESNPNGSQWVAFHGVENLPYLNNFEFVAHRPEYDPDRFQVWMLFDVWNPHQNATTPPPTSEIAEFRIHPRSGYLSGQFRYDVSSAPDLIARPGNTNPWNYHSLVPARVSNNHSVVDLNAGRDLIFENVAYPDPTIIRGERPTQPGSTPGILVFDLPYLEPAVPGNPDDIPPGLKADLNALLDFYGRELLPPDGNGFYGAKSYNSFSLRPPSFPHTGRRLMVDLQYRPAGSNDWKTYQTLNEVFPTTSSADSPEKRGLQTAPPTTTHGSRRIPGEFDLITYHGAAGGPPPEEHAFYGWRDVTPSHGVSFFPVIKPDPRTMRFGNSAHGTDVASSTVLGTTIRQSIQTPNWSDLAFTELSRQQNWRATESTYMLGLSSSPNHAPFPSEAFGLPSEAFEWANVSSFSTRFIRAMFGFIANRPEGGLDRSVNPSRYRDRDGIIRPGDGYLGAIPTANPVTASGIGSREDRPVILNRRFRSVGEMGYAFRDLPWKTLDFFSRNSGDLGLLDAFSLDETEEQLPLVAGKINLNSAPTEVLAALLAGVSKDTESSTVIGADEAMAIAEAIVEERERGPFRDRGDLVTRVLSPPSANDVGTLSEIRKHEREAAIRALAELGTTRTWNLLLDVIVQLGQMRVGAGSVADFLPKAERRVWVHLAIDRFSGEVVSSNWEIVHE